MPKLIPLCLILLSTVALADETPRSISVSGEGSVETPPDRATLVFSIVARDDDVGRAQAEAADVTAKVLALTDELGIPDSRVDTMSASVRPDYRWNRETQEQELLGFIAERQMRVELHDLEKVGVVIERAVEVGPLRADDRRELIARGRSLEVRTTAALEDSSLPGVAGRIRESEDGRRRAIFKWSFDERVENGLYCARSLEYLQELLASPEKL